MEKRQKGKTKLQQIVAAATAFMPISTRSGGISALGSFHPVIAEGSPYEGTGRSHTHRGHVRVTKKAQRRRSFYKSLRTK